MCSSSILISHPEGSLEWILITDNFFRSKVAYIKSIFVNTLNRRKKIGTKLIMELCMYLKKHRIWTIELDDCLDSGNDFYLKLGFTYKDKSDNAMIAKTCQVLTKTYVVINNNVEKNNIY